jgi:hypothetical protein
MAGVQRTILEQEDGSEIAGVWISADSFGVRGCDFHQSFVSYTALGAASRRQGARTITLQPVGAT